VRSEGKKSDCLALHGGQVDGEFTRERGTGRTGGRERTNKEERGIMDGYKAAPCSRLLRLDRIGFQTGS
jgi:hypothetical protein